MKTGDLSGTVFTNRILLKDGQTAMAGLGFIMKMDTATYFVTAKHLLGPDGGFKHKIKEEDIAQTLVAWQAIVPFRADSFAVSTGNIAAAQGDVLLFRIPAALGNPAYKTFRLSKLMIPEQTNKVLVNGMDISNDFYLVAYASGKEALFPLQLAGKYEDYYVFRKKKNVDYHGFSGGPVLDAKGNVFAIVSAGFDNNGEEQVAATKIRPLGQ
ncbi:MAG: hypothetical protein ABW019_05340 [Chitinophagaceae bacterium]